MHFLFFPIQVDTEKWDTVYQKISSRGETVEIFLEDPTAGDDPMSSLEAVATGKRRPRVRVDLAGAEFFSMEEVASEFEPEKSGGPSSVSSRTQLGYQTTEEVSEGARVFVVDGIDRASRLTNGKKYVDSDLKMVEHFPIGTP